MKSLTSLLLISLLLSIGTMLNAQNCEDFFPQKEGTTLTYKNYDKKDKVTGTSVMAFKDKQQTNSGMSVVFASTFSDDKGEKIYESEVQVECRDGVLYFDASKILDPATMSSYETMEVEVTGDNLELPLKGEAGTELEDGGVTAVVRSGGIKIITVSVSLSNRKIAAQETIETPAGSFNCIKYTYDALSQMGFIKVNMSSIEWYSADYGTIRSESYNKNGKLMSYTLLESVSGQ